jgi:RNA-splicing ligase RtcB
MEEAVTIHTSESLRKAHRRLDRRNARAQRAEMAAAKVLQAMKQGAALHRCNREHRTIWALSTGEFVAPEVAEDVQRDARVVGVGDCMFGPELSQTFRYLGGTNTQTEE